MGYSKDARTPAKRRTGEGQVSAAATREESDSAGKSAGESGNPLTHVRSFDCWCTLQVDRIVRRLYDHEKEYNRKLIFFGLR